MLDEFQLLMLWSYPASPATHSMGLLLKNIRKLTRLLVVPVCFLVQFNVITFKAIVAWSRVSEEQSRPSGIGSSHSLQQKRATLGYVCQKTLAGGIQRKFLFCCTPPPPQKYSPVKGGGQPPHSWSAGRALKPGSADWPGAPVAMLYGMDG